MFKKASKNGSTPKLVKAEPKNTEKRGEADNANSENIGNLRENIKENKNKSIETEEGLIHISKILKVMGQILSYYINRIELSCDKDYVLGIEKGMMMSLRDDINKLSARYKI